MTQEIEGALDRALLEARQALAEAEGKRAQYEVLVQTLRTEVAGLEVAINRRRSSAATEIAPASAPIIVTMLSPQQAAASGRVPSIPGEPYPGTFAGVAALVVLLTQLHKNWSEKKRASAVELVLSAAGGRIHRSAVTEALQRVGRPNDSLEDVSAALAYLNRAGRARPVGDGFWVLTDDDRQIVDR